MYRILLILGVCFLMCQAVHATPTNLDSLKQALKSMPEDSTKCEAILHIVFTLYSGDEAEKYGTQALAMAKRLNNPKLKGRAYYALAWCHGFDEMDKKTAYIDSAVHEFTLIEDLGGLGLVHNANASILLEYGEFESAKASLEKAYGYFVATGDKNRQAVILNNWGVSFNEMGKPDSALPKFNEALAFELAKQPIDAAKVGRVYLGLGESNRLLGRHLEATDYYLLSYKNRKQANTLGVSEVLTNIASMIFEAAEQGIDTTDIIPKIQAYGFPNTLALLDSAAAFPGIEGRDGLLSSIQDVRRKGHLLRGNYQEAYNILWELKQQEEEQKLSASSLEALADLKIKYEKEQLKIRLLEEEVNNRAQQNKMNLLLLSLGIVVLILVISLLVYQNRIKADRILLAEAKQAQQIVAISSMLEGEEKARARIARDLHDGLGNLLSSVKVSVANLPIDLSDPETQMSYGKSIEQIDEACTEVRKIAHEMMPEALKRLGLKKALEDLTLKMDATYDFDVHFDLYGNEQVLPDNTNVMLFRMVQELFTNIVKYADASEVLLQMTFSDAWLNLTVEDDGKGFDPAKIAHDEGMGLKSIEFRTHYLGGEYEIDSRPGMGTSVSINIPLGA